MSLWQFKRTDNSITIESGNWSVVISEIATGRFPVWKLLPGVKGGLTGNTIHPFARGIPWCPERFQLMGARVDEVYECIPNTESGTVNVPDWGVSAASVTVTAPSAPAENKPVTAGIDALMAHLNAS